MNTNVALKTPFITRGGVVASEHYLASKIGVDIMEKGGNAADAATATSLALAVTAPQMGGLGGDFFTLYHEERAKKNYCLISSGFAPKALTIEKVKGSGYVNSMPARGPLSVSVPGYVYGVFEFHRRFGSMDFSKVVEPSIELSKTGFPASRQFCDSIDRYIDILKSDRGCVETFLGGGVRIREGDLLKYPQVAKTLSLIKEGGPKAFYEGEIGAAIAEYVRSRGGVLDEDDLKRFKPEWVDPIKISYRGYEVYEVPPPSMGATTLILLNLMEQHDISRYKRLSADFVDAFVKLAKTAYRVRDENLSDPRFVEIDLERLLSKQHSRKLLNRLSPDSPNLNAEGDTTYFAAADREGNVVSAIQSLFLSFGSGLTVPDYGIPLNSRASYFRFDGVNKLEPGKRTLHTLSALILSNSRETLALGSSAGDYRPQIYTQLVANYVDFKLNLQEAVESPRFVWDHPRQLTAEEGVEVMRLRGTYDIKTISFPSNLGVAQGVKIREGVKWACCDIRGDGLPIGQLN